MQKEEVCALIESVGIIPAIRVHSEEDALFAAEAVGRGGIPIVEITMTTPGAVKLISQLVHHHPHILVGAGTVLDAWTAGQCRDAGANFLNSVTVYDALGRKAFSETGIISDKITIPTSSLPAGIYFLRLGIRDSFYMTRFMKQ